MLSPSTDRSRWSTGAILFALLLVAGGFQPALAQEPAPQSAPEEKQEPKTAEEEAEEAARAGRITPVPQLIHGLLAARRQFDLQLNAVKTSANGRERGVTHERGRLTIAWLLEDAADHEAEHVEQIRQIKAANAVSNKS